MRTYYTSQEQELVGVASAPNPVQYFALSDSERRALGVPDVDRTIYTDINAKMVLALATLYEATGEDAYKNRTVKLMQAIHQRGRRDDGSYRQVLRHSGHASGRIRTLEDGDNDITYLRSQAFAGLAALATYRVTTDQQWLEEANAIGATMIAQLVDPQTKGLRGSTRQQTLPDGRPLRDQPLVDAGAGAELLNQLTAHAYGQWDNTFAHSAEELRRYAEDSLRAVGQLERLRVQGNFIGQFVLAVNQWHDEFIQVNVVCRNVSSSTCSALHTTALRELPHARTVIKAQPPGHYPDRGDAALFICNSTACSTPMLAGEPALKDKARAYFSILDGSAG